MKIPHKRSLPLCDLILCIDQSLKEEKGNSIQNKSQAVVKMNRTGQIKREREEFDVGTKSKKERRSLRQNGKLKEKSESEEYSDSKSDSEEENRFKENQRERSRLNRKAKLKEESESEDEYYPDSGAGMSEYEKMIKRNREERLSFLKSIKINEIKEEFVKSVESVTRKPKPQPKKRINTYKKPKVVEILPLRKSRRLAKMDIDLSEKALSDKAMAEVASETEASLPSNYPFEEAISVQSDLSAFVENFNFKIEDDGKFLPDYASNFKNMKIRETSVAKLVPTRITSLAVHPATDNIIVIVGSKFGHLGFWNVTSSTDPILFLPHSGGVTNLKVNPYISHQLISSSHDGTLRCGDMEKKSFNEIYNVSYETSCSYFDFVSASTLLVSQKNGNVSIIDARNGSLSSEKKHPCHEYAVKTVHIHPTNKNIFLTADGKGNIKLWDMRKLQKRSMIDVCHHKRSVSSAFFSPVTGKYILTTSLDDSLCIFDSSNIENEILFKMSLKHNNWTGRWLTPFKATWLPHSEELFTVGSMNYPRRIEIYNTGGNNVFNFTNDEYLNSVTSANEFHPSLNILAGGNSSGKVFVFADTQLSF